MAECLNFACPNHGQNLSQWCDDCLQSLSIVDKYYVIGFVNAWPVRVENKEFRAAYEMGVADRKGSQDGMPELH